MAGGNHLLRLSLPAARVSASITLGGTVTSDLASNTAGNVLIVGEANEGAGTVQRRDPLNGNLLAQTPIMLGVGAPDVGGITANGVWVSEATGMMGGVQLYDLTTLTPVGATCSEGRTDTTCLLGSNGITARVVNGILWITQLAGGPQSNFCADPSDGQVLATIPLPNEDEDVVESFGSRYLYVESPSVPGGIFTSVFEEPIPTACNA